jgi:hypothetical protein
VPRQVAPPGTKLLSRLRVDNWVLARFVLVRPKRLSIDQLIALAPRFFRRRPPSSALLVFTQRRDNKA